MTGGFIMPETVRELHLRDRLQSMQRLAGVTQAEQAAASWQEYKEIVALCLELSTSGRDLFEQEYRRIFRYADLTVGWLQERRLVIEDLSDRYVQLAESIRSVAYRAWETAGSPAGEDIGSLLDRAIRVVTEAKHAVLEQWPVGSPEETAEAKAAIARGETVPADEAFAEIAGTDVESWRKKVEEYKRCGQRSAGGSECLTRRPGSREWSRSRFASGPCPTTF
jgi:hypothetical protein